MTEIKDPILAAMEFSLNYTLKRFEDAETEDGKIIREGIIRGKTLVEHLRIFGADVYGKTTTSLSSAPNSLVVPQP